METFPFPSTILPQMLFSNPGTSSDTTGWWLYDKSWLMFDVPPQLRDQHSSHLASNGRRNVRNLARHHTMPVTVNDKRQVWLRENAPRPESLQSVKTDSKLRVIMDTGNEHFGQFYKIDAMVSYLHGNTATFMYWLHM